MSGIPKNQCRNIINIQYIYNRVFSKNNRLWRYKLLKTEKK